MKRRLVSLFLAIALAVSLFPTSVFATEDPPTETIAAETAVDPQVPSQEATIPTEAAPAVAVSFDRIPAELTLTVFTESGEAVPAGEDGTYFLTPGTYRYLAECENYEDREESFTVCDTDLTVKVTLTPTETTEPAPEETAALRVTFHCQPGDLELTVLDAAGASVSPEEDGTFLLLPGSYCYEARRDGYAPAQNVSFLVEDQALDITVTLPPLEISSVQAPEGYVPVPDDSQSGSTILSQASEASEGPDVLLIQTTLPWKSSANETVLSQLTSQGKIKGYAKLAIADAKGMDFSGYRLVIIANEQTDDFYDKYELIRVPIENYVSEGGAVAFGVCDQGWNNSTFSWTLPGGVEKANRYTYYNYIADPESPLVTGQYTNGVALTNSMLYNTYCSHTYFIESTLPNGTQVILRDSDNNAPTLVDYPFGKGHIIASGLTWEHAYEHRSGSFAQNSLDDYFMYSYNRSSLAEDDSTLPIIVVPGVMGSRLFRNSSCTEDSMVWGSSSVIFDTARQIGAAMNISNTLYVTGEGGLFLETDSDKEYGTVDTYENLVKFLRQTYPDREIYFFSYDWRQSNSDSATSLHRALVNHSINKAVFICHSMGGLVISNYVAKYNSSSVEKIITLGTPYDGATRLMEAVLTDKVLTGIQAVANSSLTKGGLTYEIKRNLLGVAELTPNTLYWQKANAENKCYRRSQDAGNALRLTSTSPFYQFPNFSSVMSLRSWAYFPAYTSKDEKDNKAAAKKWLSALEQSYKQQNLTLLDISCSTSRQTLTITPIVNQPVDYTEALKLIYPGYSSMQTVQKTVQKGIQTLAGMSNAYFAIGDSEKTMSGITLVINGTQVSPDNYDYLSIGDGTVPFASANQLQGSALTRARYFSLEHGELAGSGNKKEWSKVKNWIRSIIEETAMENCGRETPNIPKKMTVIRVACPVDVTIERGGEILTSNPDSISYYTSFGSMDLAGENNEIKIFCLDSYDDYNVTMRGTGEGEMDYSIRFYGEDDSLIGEWTAENVPVTPSSVMSTGTDDSVPLSITVDPQGDGQNIQEYLLADPSGSVQPVQLAQEYILLAKGQTGQLRASVTPEALASQLRWTATDESGMVFDADPVITIDETTGQITALSEGTAYAVAYLENGSNLFFARCRVDVTGTEETPEQPVASRITNVSLPSDKVTVELYRTDYTRFDVLLELEQLLNPASANALVPGQDLPQQEAGGIAIQEASFTDPQTAALFDLRVVDDRTLEIIPKYSALEAAQEKASNIKSSYKSAVNVVIDGKVFTCADGAGHEKVLTLSVKQSLPTIKPAALTFYAALPEQGNTLSFSGAKVVKIEADAQTAAKNAKTDASAWLDVDPESGAVSFREGTVPQKSGKLYLTLTLEGWAVKQNTVVSVSTSFAAPKVTLSPSSATVLAESYDRACLTYRITPAPFAGIIPTVTRITEGSGKTLKTYENGEVLSCECTEGRIYVSALHSPDDGKTHTYKVYLTAANKELSFTVKVLPSNTQVTASVKASGGINTALPNSPITLTVSLKNFHPDSVKNYNVVIKQYKAGTKDSLTIDRTVSQLFNISVSGNAITLTEATPGTLEQGYTYFAYVSADIADNVSTTQVKTKLNIKWGDPSKLSPSISLKASGSIDTIRPDTHVVLKPTVKNDYTFVPQPEDLVFYRTYQTLRDGKKVTVQDEETQDYFDVAVQGGAYIVKLKPGAALTVSDRFKVAAEAQIRGSDCISAKCSLKLTTGRAKFTASPAALTLLAKDRYCEETIRLETSDETLSEIAGVMLDAVSAKYFTLTELGDGTYALSYRHNLIPEGFTAGTKKTVKLNICLKGAPEGTVCGTVSVPVQIR